jgi:hypothetical protein
MMLPDTEQGLQERLEPGPLEVERLNLELSSVNIGDRLRLVVKLPLLSPEYAREFLFTAFPFLGTPGVYLDLGPYLQADTETAAFDYAEGLMTVEADVIREASPGVFLGIVLAAAVVALAAAFPSATVVVVERLRRAFQPLSAVVSEVAKTAGEAAGTAAGGAVGGITAGLVKGLGLPGVLLLVGAGIVILQPGVLAQASKVFKRR